ncbi:hypothetical protein [Kallotenue papyrolyticum]|uniref:baeRF10 domain-containing protein n=1 Tax=Kallotenue papyrolyticum TaxID=1325125 RepID=UPI00046F3D7E|nr:hypothetical protein [Kallotenue papyrolyticum]
MPENLQEVLERLAAYPASEHPFLSVYLDLSADGSGRRPSTATMRALEQEFDRISQRVAPHGQARASLEADRERIMQYVSRDVPDDARGVAIFACQAAGVWHAVPLQTPVETSIIADRLPSTFELARILDDYEPYAVVVADGQESRIFLISSEEAQRIGGTEADEPIKRFDAGGWAQMILQRRTDNVIKAHTKEIAAELERVIRRYGVQHIIIATNDAVKGMINESLTPPIRERLVDLINLDPHSTIDEMLAAVAPKMREVERQQEADDVETLEAQVNTKGGLGVVGVRDTALALSKGQVRHLIMLQDFNALGSHNPATGFLYEGYQSRDPYDGSELQQVNLREAFTARAAQQGATIQIVEHHDYLAQHGGVGALLWYNDSVQQPQQLEQPGERARQA